MVVALGVSLQTLDSASEYASLRGQYEANGAHLTMREWSLAMIVSSDAPLH